jgi:hypothetical protein
MPDITHPLVATPFVAGDVLDPVRVADGLYEPKSTPDNMGVMNGFLDEDNLATPYTVDYRLVRPGSFTTAKSVGQTANFDFFSDFFQGDYRSNVYSECYDRALTAVGIRFYVPYDCTTIMLTWHVGLVVDGQHLHLGSSGAILEDADNITEAAPDDAGGVLATAAAWRGGGAAGTNELSNSTLLSLFLDGTQEGSINRQIRIGKQSMTGSKYVTGTNKLKPLSDGGAAGVSRHYWNHSRFPDHRWWSGHFNVDSGTMLTKGWHTASIRVTNAKWKLSTITRADGTSREKVAPHVRFKTCRFTAIPIR